jgi:hypothetical protein
LNVSDGGLGSQIMYCWLGSDCCCCCWIGTLIDGRGEISEGDREWFWFWVEGFRSGGRDVDGTGKAGTEIEGADDDDGGRGGESMREEMS